MVAYELAKQLDDKVRILKYQQALDLAFQNLSRLQYTASRAAAFIEPKKSIGAIRISVKNPALRIDTTQHMLDALLKWRRME